MTLTKLTVNGQSGIVTVDQQPLRCRWVVGFAQSHFTVALSRQGQTVCVNEIHSNESCYGIDDLQLEPSCHYEMEVVVYGTQGERHVFSNVIMTSNKGRFSGKWITSFGGVADDEHYYQDGRNQVFRKTVNLSESEDEAFIHIVGLGYYTLFVNGQKVSTYELNTDWTNYAKCVYYDTFDISNYLHKGDNEIFVELGNGWYNPAPLTLFGKYNLRKNLTTGQPMLLADIVLRGEGKCRVVGTDDTWEYTDGPFVFNNLYLGEKFDFRRFDPNDRATYGYSEKWSAATFCHGPIGQLTQSYLNKISRGHQIEPSSIRSVSAQEHIIDFGVMVSGFIDAQFSASLGAEVEFVYSEQLDSCGELDTDSTLAGFVGKQVEPSVVVPGGEGAPIRAEQRDRCVCRDGVMRFTNRYTYHSFRYVKIKGITLEQISAIKAVYANTVLEETAQFSSSDQGLNALYAAAKLTRENNVHSVIEDCARERLAYGGDMVALAHSQALMFDSSKLYEKTIKDFVADQRVNGGLPETAPFMGIQTKGTGDGAGPIGWQLVVPYLLKIHYQHYGDVSLVREILPALERQMTHLRTLDQGNLGQYCLGDWGSSVADKSNVKNGSPALNFTSACFYYYHLTLLAELRHIAGLEESEPYLASEIDDYKSSLITQFRNDDGTYADRSQTSFVFALYFELEPDATHLILQLKEKIKSAGFAIECGIFGQSFLYQIACKYDLNNIVYQWLNNEAGVIRMLQDGSGSLNEFFGENYNGSCNHAMFSSYVSWLYSGLGGISIDHDACAADRVTIQPYFSPHVDEMNCSFHSVRGEITCCWKRVSDTLIDLRVEVPLNLKSARVILPRVWFDEVCHIPVTSMDKKWVELDISDVRTLKLTLKTGLLSVKDHGCY